MTLLYSPMTAPINVIVSLENNNIIEGLRCERTE